MINTRDIVDLDSNSNSSVHYDADKQTQDTNMPAVLVPDYHITSA
jgi:hypothetical protein